ncbi:MAG: hypothetical protein ING36_08130 [Burkholderiales bacterium]|jgi:hypothetical protein|nr:hypothetical protein [Burkholderiales bacterium]MCA3164676.1 hypothetical protein [Burkholderiales bacterium]MCA3166800.1 hypothetical protein [Burkholderiales bacterium]MCA3170888.1 hypothetical protein [Burkholderiales bacterium]MCA3173186.1 hypothetical protein [Burkholderiales bacterium]
MEGTLMEPLLSRIMQVLWPSFLMATVASGLFFSLFNPEDVYVFGFELTHSPMGVYTIGFLLFWALCAASSWITYLLVRPVINTGEGQKKKTENGAA